VSGILSPSPSVEGKPRRVLTMVPLVVGTSLGGVILGILLVGSSRVVEAANPALSWILAVGLLVMSVGTAVSPRLADGLRLTWARQVPIEWTAWSRRSLLGVAWGAWLGVGLLSHSRTPGFNIMLVSALLLSSWVPLLVGLVYGAARGTALAARAVMRSSSSESGRSPTIRSLRWSRPPIALFGILVACASLL